MEHTEREGSKCDTHAPCPDVQDPTGVFPVKATTYLCGATITEHTKLVEWGRPTCPQCFARGLTLRDAQTELSNRVYEATRLLEELETAGKVVGNGHHMRQQLCEAATKLLADRWGEKP